MKAYEDLANAIIIQAATDFKDGSKKLKKFLAQEPPPDPPSSEKDGRRKLAPHARWEEKVLSCKGELADIKRFFHSQWFTMLSNVDGPSLYRAIEREVRKL